MERARSGKKTATTAIDQRYTEKVEMFNKSELAILLGMECTEAWDNRAKVVMGPEGKRGPYTVAHGGAIFTLADQAFGIAANLVEKQVALSVHIEYLAPSTGRLEAVAEKVADSQLTSLYRVTVYEGTRTIAIFDGVAVRV